MKIIQIIVLIVFSGIILMPIITFNFEENAVSLIDNRKLSDNPFSARSSEGGDLTENIQSYVNDRIGFRDDMILAYTIFNDKVFNKMEHPSYVYGRDGYVFGAGLTVNNPYTAYHEVFADMVKKIQDYCEERNVPFLFVFNPAKPAVLSEYISSGINYDRSWVDSFLLALDERGVRYIDNTTILTEKTEQGEVVFNQKYDANHWNDLGAYYGTNAMLEELKKDIPTIHVNELDELNISQTLQTSLPVSEFPINEYVPAISINSSLDSGNTKKYAEELYRNPSYQNFGYYKNELRATENAPKALVFQGSYMNGFGYKYLANGFSEYIHIHDYQNVIDFSYYYNIFQPDCVIFEVAEYTLSNVYFNYDKMYSTNYSPTIETIEEQVTNIEDKKIDENMITVSEGNALTKIVWQCFENNDYVWLLLDNEYDMKKTASGYEISILSEKWNEKKDNFKIVTLKDGTKTIHTL